MGIAATQLCKTVKDVTVFGTASASKHETISEGGVTHPIDYRTKDYVEEVRKISPKGEKRFYPVSGFGALDLGFTRSKKSQKHVCRSVLNTQRSPADTFLSRTSCFKPTGQMEFFTFIRFISPIHSETGSWKVFWGDKKVLVCRIQKDFVHVGVGVGRHFCPTASRHAQ